MIEITKLHESGRAARSLRLSKGGKQLITPTYFPAISGTQHNFQISGLLETVIRSSFPQVLISAYDFPMNAGPRIAANLNELKKYQRKDLWVMLDSGIFESSRLEDEEWFFDEYQKVVKGLDSDLYFAFDTLPQKRATNPEYARATAEEIGRSNGLRPPSQCVSVVHGLSPKQLLYVAHSLSKSIPDQMKFVAVPERDCGRTLLERARMILRLRKILASRGEVFLHVLGCGDPVSMALYTYCGADCFDSLDWTEQFVDRAGFNFRNLSHADIIECDCQVCQRHIKPILGGALLHNLLFYRDFSEQLQNMVRRNRLRDFLLEFVGAKDLAKFE